MELQSITWPSAANNTPGIQQRAYIIDIGDVLTVPTPVETDPLTATVGATLAHLATISADIVLKPNTSFKEVYITQEEGELTSDLQGPMDGKSYMNKFTISHPGSRPGALGFLSYIKNGSFLLLIGELEGQVRVLGTKGYPAKVVDGKGTSGKGAATGKMQSITFQSCGNTPCPVFTGNVMLGATPVVLAFL